MTRRSLPFARLAVLLAGGSLLVACGSSSDSKSTLPADADVTVKAEDGLKWDAENFTATATDGKVLIAAENDSSLAHNLYVVAADGTQAPQFIDLPSKGSSDAKDFSLTAGTYTILCKIPGHSNMKATLVVS